MVKIPVTINRLIRMDKMNMISRVRLARLGGFLYLLIILFGLIAQIFVRDHLVDYQNAANTAKNILKSEFWFRLGFVAELLMLVCDIGVTTILFVLLQQTSKGLSILSTLMRTTSISILGITALSHYAALSFLEMPPFLKVFNASQLEALSLLTIRFHGIGYNISLFFFGFHLIVLGYIIYRGQDFPKSLGFMLVVGGVSYIVNSLTWFLFPDFVKVIYPVILIPSALGEWLFCFWLIIKGVKRSDVNLQPV